MTPMCKYILKFQINTSLRRKSCDIYTLQKIISFLLYGVAPAFHTSFRQFVLCYTTCCQALGFPVNSTSKTVTASNQLSSPRIIYKDAKQNTTVVTGDRLKTDILVFCLVLLKKEHNNCKLWQRATRWHSLSRMSAV